MNNMVKTMYKKDIEPLSSEDKAFIMKVLRYLAVELGTLAPEADILSAIKSSGFKCIPKGVLADMIIHGYAKTEGDNIRLVVVDSNDNNDKGGENMKPDYKNKYTSGEEKVARAVIKKFGEGFKIRSPSRMVFEDCLRTGFPKIGNNSHQATEKLIQGGYLQEKEGKILLGEKGKEILSQ